MRKTLYEISHEHNIPSNTLRVAIHRGVIEADKVGHIRMIEDESENFKTYLAQYNARQTHTTIKNALKKTETFSQPKELGKGFSNL
ncbi:MAG: hypothetical protein HXX20_18545 [Chloroflexi bacterium]|nr:hypothetical protein [Chloroflexota bacterium]